MRTRLYLIPSQSTRNRPSFSLLPLFPSLSPILGAARRERLRKDGAEREDSDKNTGVLAAQRERDQGMEERGEENLSASRVSRRMRFDKPVVSFNPRRRIIPDVYLRRVHGPDPSTYGIKTRLYMCERVVHENGYYAMRYTHPLSLSVSTVASVASRRAAFTCDFSYITARYVERFRCWTWDFTQMHGSSPRRMAWYTRNWERATLKFVTVTVQNTEMFRHAVWFSLEELPGEYKLPKLFSLLDEV